MAMKGHFAFHKAPALLEPTSSDSLESYTGHSLIGYQWVGIYTHCRYTHCRDTADTPTAETPTAETPTAETLQIHPLQIHCRYTHCREAVGVSFSLPPPHPQPTGQCFLKSNRTKTQRKRKTKMSKLKADYVFHFCLLFSIKSGKNICNSFSYPIVKCSTRQFPIVLWRHR